MNDNNNKLPMIPSNNLIDDKDARVINNVDMALADLFNHAYVAIKQIKSADMHTMFKPRVTLMTTDGVIVENIDANDDPSLVIEDLAIKYGRNKKRVLAIMFTSEAYCSVLNASDHTIADTKDTLVNAMVTMSGKNLIKVCEIKGDNLIDLNLPQADGIGGILDSFYPIYANEYVNAMGVANL